MIASTYLCFFQGDVQIHLIYKSAGQEGLVDLLNGEMGCIKDTLPNALGPRTLRRSFSHCDFCH